MGMRCTQPMGLPSEAVNFLIENAKRLDPCEHCGRDSGYVQKQIDTTGMFGDLEICEYELKDGRVAHEFVQAEIWSSGPMIWMALKVGYEEFCWTEAEIKKDSGEDGLTDL